MLIIKLNSQELHFLNRQNLKKKYCLFQCLQYKKSLLGQLDIKN